MNRSGVQRTLSAAFMACVTVVATMALGSNVANAAPAVQPIYAAVGDSYPSGPGSGFSAEDTSVYEEGTGANGDRCFRATSAYPKLVADAKGYKLFNATCSGATTTDILNPVQRGSVTVPAQIDSVLPNTNVVTITIGGNDAKFVPFVECVVGVKNLTDLIGMPNVESFLKAATPCSEASPAVRETRTEITKLQSKVTTVINEVKRRAPAAKIIVTGYPQVVESYYGTTGTCTPFLTVAESALANDINKSLNDQIRKAATASGVSYVNFYQTGGFTPGSDACSPAPWRKINGLTIPAPEAAFHPNNQGQWAMADLVKQVA